MRARQRHLNPRDLGAKCAFDSRVISGLNNNDSVTTWSDRTANAYDASQSTAAKKPTYKTNELNGNPAVSFDGGDGLATSTFSASIAATAVTVFKASANGIVIERGTNFDVNGASFLYTTIGACSYFRGTGTYPVQTSGKNIANNWGSDGTWRIVVQECNGTHASHSVFLNGVSQSLTNSLSETNDPGTSSYTISLNIGARNNAASVFLTGSIAGVGLFPFLESPVRKRLQSSLAYSFKIACS